MTITAPAPSRRRLILIRSVLGLLAAGLLAGAGLLGYFYFAIYPNVPDIGAVTDYQPKIPLRIYTADNVLIGQFGQEHRDFVPISKIPDRLKKAVLAIEDTRFYEHFGVDWRRALSALRANLAGGYRQGGSTITMQVARNFFLTRDKLISRKANEVALALKIEQALSKDQILELYMNQIFLGRRSYGFGSAARAYFNKDLNDLSIAEAAMLAGVPQDPVRHNPAVNPRRAKQRQLTVLRRMREVGYITQAEFQAALDAPISIASARQEFDTKADYVAELARQAVYERYKEEAYTRGIVVITTIRKAEQDAAYDSVRRNVLAYDQRHGYRGPEAVIELPDDPAAREDAINETLRARPASDGLFAVMVTKASPSALTVETIDGASIDIGAPGLKFVAPALAASARAGLKLRPGAVVRIMQDKEKGWMVVQLPKVSAALVAIDTVTGAYHALVGGFDFNLQKYNHVTQAWRQPGSAIKPFVYSAALERGYSPATQILDEALDMPGENAGATWSPQNDDGKFDGQVSMRHALAHSKNVPTVRLLRAVGVGYAHSWLERFGFTPGKHPGNLTMALGTGAVTPLQLAGAYAVFANGGYRVAPYLIARIQDSKGAILADTAPRPLDQRTRVLDERNAFLVDSMLRDVARYGTGAAASKRLGRSDIAGKTGTTNDAVDGWFAGYASTVSAVAWMGYDDPKSLGGREFGATLAMPIWIDYMAAALHKQTQEDRPVPDGLTQVDDDWIYTEYVDDAEFRSIDIDAVPELEPEVPPAPAPVE
ncbi:MAG: PBP1A family penicillin-binding protein [Pseudomonadota bacterium]